MISLNVVLFITGTDGFGLEYCRWLPDVYYSKWQRLNLLIRNKHDLLHLHSIEQLVSFNGLRERHDLFGHESEEKGGKS